MPTTTLLWKVLGNKQWVLINSTNTKEVNIQQSFALALCLYVLDLEDTHIMKQKYVDLQTSLDILLHLAMKASTKTNKQQCGQFYKTDCSL